MADDLNIHLRRHYIQQARAKLPRLPGNLRQLGARGPVVMPVAPGSQSVMVKVNITQAHTTGQHLAYLTHAKGPEGQDALLFGPGAADRRQFLQAAHQDPRQFRLVVSPAVPEVGDRTRFIARFMAQVERDLRLPLDWVAAHHFDTAHPHTHIALRGRSHTGKAFLLAKHYKQDGLQARAQQVLTWLLGRPPLVQEQVRQVQRGSVSHDAHPRLLGTARGHQGAGVSTPPLTLTERVDRVRQSLQRQPAYEQGQEY
jgi:hypothetical protein